MKWERTLERIDSWPANCRSTTKKKVELVSGKDKELFDTNTREGYIDFTKKIVEGQLDLYSKGIKMMDCPSKVNIDFEMGPVLTKHSDRRDGVIITPYTVGRTNKPIRLGIADSPSDIPTLIIELDKGIKEEKNILIQEIKSKKLKTDIKVTIFSETGKNCKGLNITVDKMVDWITINAKYLSGIKSAKGAKKREEGYRASFLADFFGGLQVLSALWWCWNEDGGDFSTNFHQIFNEKFYVPSKVYGNDPVAQEKIKGLSNEPFEYFALRGEERLCEDEKIGLSKKQRVLYIVDEDKGNEIDLMDIMANMMQKPETFTDFFKKHINTMSIRHDAGVNDFDDELFIHWVVKKLGLDKTELEQISIRDGFILDKKDLEE